MCSGEKNKNIKSVLLSVYELVTPALFVSSCISSLACLHLLHRQNKWIHPIIQFTFFFFEVSFTQIDTIWETQM